MYGSPHRKTGSGFRGPGTWLLRLSKPLLQTMKAGNEFVPEVQKQAWGAKGLGPLWRALIGKRTFSTGALRGEAAFAIGDCALLLIV
jgi:hypothetical protein